MSDLTIDRLKAMAAELRRHSMDDMGVAHPREREMAVLQRQARIAALADAVHRMEMGASLREWLSTGDDCIREATQAALADNTLFGTISEHLRAKVLTRLIAFPVEPTETT